MDAKLDVYEKLSEIQQQLKVPKTLQNKFGGYNYRSCESILEAIKPLLNGAALTICDDIHETGGKTYFKNKKDDTEHESVGRIYVKATASFHYGGEKIEVTAFAREVNNKKKMDAAQITGAASSYARKYALSGLFCIDDTSDPDSLNNSEEYTSAKEAPSGAYNKQPEYVIAPEESAEDSRDNESLRLAAKRDMTKIVALCKERDISPSAFAKNIGLVSTDVMHMRHVIRNFSAEADRYFQKNGNDSVI